MRSFFFTLMDSNIIRYFFKATIFSLLFNSIVLAETFTLRVGSGHPAGPTVYATVIRDYFVPEIKRRVAEETEHELRVVEGYGGSIASVVETLEAVQIGILDIGDFFLI